MFKKIIAAGALTLALTGCGGGINSVEEAMDQLATASTDAEHQEAVDYLMENMEDEAEAVAPAPITIEFNEPNVNVEQELRDALNRNGSSTSDIGVDMRESGGLNARMIKVSANVTNTSDANLPIPEWGAGFEAYEGAGQVPVDSYVGYAGFGDITGVERMPTIIPPGETVEFAETFIFSEDENLTVTFNWNDDEGRTATATEVLQAP